MEESIEERRIQRILSRLSFVKADLEAIKQVQLEDLEIKNIISEIKDKTDDLTQILLNQLNKNGAN